MSRFLKSTLVAAGLLVALTGNAAFASGGKLGIGREAAREEVAGWDIDIRPDGLGLPDGEGDPLTGEEIFLEKCAACHGDFAEGRGNWPVLMGGKGSLKSDHPVKTIGSYWPYATTVFDYIRRAMPFGEAQTLTNDQVYSLTAFLLYVNELIPEDQVVNKDNLAEIKLPNENGFVADPRPDSPADGKPCMSNCKAEVKILNRAKVIDVTPEHEEEAKD